MNNKKLRKLEIYCQATFNALKSNLELWDPTDEDIVRVVTRFYYEGIFSCQYGDTGLISEEASKAVSTDRTDDHCWSPQFVGRYVMDNAHIYLEDYDEFRNLFQSACTKIKVLKSENRKLSQLTSNKQGESYKVFVPTDKKYQHLGINLFKRPDGKVRWDSAQPTDETIKYHKGLLEYEKQFVVNENG